MIGYRGSSRPSQVESLGSAKPVHEATRVRIRRFHIVYAFKQALMDLEEQGRVVARPSVEDRKKGTFADRVLVVFPDILQNPDEPVIPHASAV